MEWTWSWKTVGVAITDKMIRSLVKPNKGTKIYYDSHIKGLGISVSTTGVRSFVLNYTIHGRARRMTIGQFPAWTNFKAREQANKCALMIYNSHDPLEEREEKRGAWTVSPTSDLSFSACAVMCYGLRVQAHDNAKWIYNGST